MAKRKIACAVTAATMMVGGLASAGVWAADSSSIAMPTCTPAEVTAVDADSVAVYDGVEYSGLNEIFQILNETEGDETHQIVMLKDITTDGYEMESGARFDLNLNCKTVTITGNTGWRILNESIATIKNGKIVGSGEMDTLIHTGSWLDLSDVVLDGTAMKAGATTLAADRKSVDVDGTSIYATKNGGYAVDVQGEGGSVSLFGEDNLIDGDILVRGAGAASSNMHGFSMPWGVVNGRIIVTEDRDYQVWIDGGIFSERPQSNWVPERNVIYAAKDGTYKVVSKNMVDIGGYVNTLMVQGETLDLHETVWANSPTDYAGGWNFVEKEDNDNVMTINEHGVAKVVDDMNVDETTVTVTITDNDGLGFSRDLLITVRKGITVGHDWVSDADGNYYSASVEFANAVEGAKGINFELAEVSEDLSKAVPELKLVYDITVVDANGNPMSMGDGNEATVTLRISRKVLEGYNNFKIVYIKNDGTISDEVFATEAEYDEISDTYAIKFKTTHFSKYGVEAWSGDAATPDSGQLTNETVIEAKADEGVAVIVAVALVAVVILIGALKIAKKH